ncbi:MAG: CvpA family protein [Lautropia sp.]|nr:CvpA family protein [Lautropia sp.]
MPDGLIPSLTSWDWFILTVAFVSTGLGIWRGMIRTVFGLAAWILGIIGAPLVGMVIGQQFGISGVPMWVLYIVAFLLTFMVVRLIGVVFLKGARSVGLAGVDRMLGAALGVARAGLVVLVAAVIAHRMGFSQTASWQAAAARPLLETMIEVAQPWLPAVRKV